MENDQSTTLPPDWESIELSDTSTPESPDDAIETQSEPVTEDVISTTAPERPVSETVGTGSFFGIGCSIVALLFVCVGIAIFMWRQTH